MSKSSRTIRLIESSLHGLETQAGAGPMDALGLLDELQRLERKWNEQVAAGSTRRIDADFRTLSGWYRRWVLAAKGIAGRSSGEDNRQLLDAIERVEKSLKK